jgi:hypothetical protein
MADDGARYRVRKLTQTGRGEAAHSRDISGEAGRVYDVAAEESELPADEIRSRLERSELISNDLVFENGAWVELVDSVAFGEVASRRAPFESVGRLTPDTMVVVLPLLVLLALVIALMVRS